MQLNVGRSGFQARFHFIHHECPKVSVVQVSPEVNQTESSGKKNVGVAECVIINGERSLLSSGQSKISL